MLRLISPISASVKKIDTVKTGIEKMRFDKSIEEIIKSIF